MNVTVGVSNRHIHLTKEDFNILFGNDFKIERIRDIKQPGQYVTNCTLTIKTNKNEIKGVKVIGPARSYTQVEISKTDAYFLGLNPPIRKSGDVHDGECVTLIGPNGSIETNTCIIPDRHIHMLPNQADMYGFYDNEIVDILVSGEKGGILSNVKIRVRDNSYFEIHLDTDDANAHFLKNNDIVTIIKRK